MNFNPRVVTPVEEKNVCLQDCSQGTSGACGEGLWGGGVPHLIACPWDQLLVWLPWLSLDPCPQEPSVTVSLWNELQPGLITEVAEQGRGGEQFIKSYSCCFVSDNMSHSSNHITQ